jgi:hypothetical protein
VVVGGEFCVTLELIFSYYLRGLLSFLLSSHNKF